MTYWQTILLSYPIAVIGFHASSWTYWRLFHRHEGAGRPNWGEAFSDSWYFVLGVMWAMFFYRPNT